MEGNGDKSFLIFSAEGLRPIYTHCDSEWQDSASTLLDSMQCCHSPSTTLLFMVPGVLFVESDYSNSACSDNGIQRMNTNPAGGEIHEHRRGEWRRLKGIPDDGLFDGVVEGHEELRVLPDAAYKVSDKHVQAVGWGGLDPCWDPTVVCLDVWLVEGTTGHI